MTGQGIPCWSITPLDKALGNPMVSMLMLLLLSVFSLLVSLLTSFSKAWQNVHLLVSLLLHQELRWENAGHSVCSTEGRAVLQTCIIGLCLCTGVSPGLVNYWRNALNRKRLFGVPKSRSIRYETSFFCIRYMD